MSDKNRDPLRANAAVSPSLLAKKSESSLDLEKVESALASQGILGIGTDLVHTPTFAEQLASPGSQGILGIGTDLVHTPTFAEQLASPGSQFGAPGANFTARELRRAKNRAAAKGDSEAVHLAAVWAIKESVVKAWVSALARLGVPAPIGPDDVKWAQIEVRHGLDGAPSVELVGEMATVFGHSVVLPKDTSRNPTPPPQTTSRNPTPPPQTTSWLVSASHDGDYALGFAVLALV